MGVYTGLGPARLRELCAERGIDMPPSASTAAMQNKLKTDDADQAKVRALRQVARELGVELPEKLTRNEAEQLLSRAMLDNLTASRYFVPGSNSERTFKVGRRPHITTGAWRDMAGHIEVSVRSQQTQTNFIRVVLVFASITPSLQELYSANSTKWAAR